MNYSAILLAGVIAATTFGWTSAARANGPATQPAPANTPGGDSADQSDEHRPRWGSRDGYRRRSSYGMRGPVSDEQWPAVMEFMKQNSPRRAADIEALQGEPRGQFLRGLVANRYDYLMSLKNEDPSGAIYAMQLDKLQTEDTIYGLLSDAQKSGGEPDKAKLRELVAKLVDVNFKEREHRIKKIRESLERSEKSLSTDKQRRDNLVEERIGQFLQDGPSPSFPNPDGPPRRRPEDDNRGR